MLSDLIKATNNDFASVVDDGVPAADVSGFIDTGSYMLNALVSGSIFGGIQDNKFTMVAGEQGTGKTFLALSAVKHFLDKDPTANVIYFDTEAAVGKQTCVERGIDPKRVAIVSVVTVEQFRHQCLSILEAYIKIPKTERRPLLIIVDSIGMLSTEKEVADMKAGNDTRDMTRAQLLKGAFRVLTLHLAKAGVALIGTNHTYSTIGFISEQVASGGSGPQYSASAILYLSKAREKDGGVQTGTKPLCTLAKGRFTKEGSRTRCMIDFSRGLERYYGMIDAATECGAFTKSGHRYIVPDGSAQWAKEISANPEKYFTEEVMQKIDEYCKKMFMYGSAIGDEMEEEEGAMEHVESTTEEQSVE